MIGPDGESWTLAAFTEGAETTAEWSLVDLSKLATRQRLEAEYYRPIYLSTTTLLENMQHIQLGEALKVLYRYPTFYGFEYQQDEGVLVLKGQDIQATGLIQNKSGDRVSQKIAAEFPNTILKTEDIVVSVRGAVGKAGIVTRKLAGSQISPNLIRLSLHEENPDPYYVWIFLNSRLGQVQFDRFKTLTAQETITSTDIEEIIVPTLSPEIQLEIRKQSLQAIELNTRSKILYAEAEALVLDALGLDAVLDAEDEAPLTYTQSSSRVWTAGRLDSEYWEPLYTRLVDYLESIPHTTLGDLADFSNGATPRGANYLDDGIPFLRIQNVDKNRLDLDDVVYIDEETHNGLLERSQLQPNDVLITITGRIGTAAVIPESLPVANINQHVVRMRWTGKGINPYYLAVFLNSRGGRLQTEREAYGTTRTALPYYCLERVIVPKVSQEVQTQIEATIRKGKNARQEAHRLLEEAKAQVEVMVLGA